MVLRDFQFVSTLLNANTVLHLTFHLMSSELKLFISVLSWHGNGKSAAHTRSHGFGLIPGKILDQIY